MPSHDSMHDLSITIQYKIMGLKSNIVLLCQRTSFRRGHVNKEIHKMLVHPIGKFLITKHQLIH